MATKINHTPGPWVVAMEAEIDGELMPDGSGGCSYTGRDVYDRRLGVVTKEDWESEYEPEPLARPYLEADAHLISAAPELLAACQSVLDAVAQPNAMAAIAASLVQVEAAIAKAAGAK